MNGPSRLLTVVVSQQTHQEEAETESRAQLVLAVGARPARQFGEELTVKRTLNSILLYAQRLKCY